MQGRSLVPLFRGETPKDWRRSFYYHYYEYPGAHSVARHYGVTNGAQKLIHYYELGEWELFDLAKDPSELTSVYGQPEYAGIQKQLGDELTRLRTEFKLPAEDPEESRPKKRQPQPGKQKGKGKANPGKGAKAAPKKAA